MRWDLFCRVIDNFGDLGVCWRLARDLATRGEAVRLVVDDASALPAMSGGDLGDVRLAAWADAVAAEVADVVIEAFGCDPPPAYVDAMAVAPMPPVWVNLEYLSAEGYVERSHGLPSPVQAARGLMKWFFYPGFVPGTGGLLREPGLLAERAAFDAASWLAARGWLPDPGERLVSVFCYPGADLPGLVDALARHPTRLMATAPAVPLLQGLPLPGSVRVTALPWLTQPQYDRLLWACDLNVVRGEDSFVRASWAAAPFLWHVYRQHDGAHERKLGAFIDRHTAGAAPDLAAAVARAQRCFNGLAPGPLVLPPAGPWRAHAVAWREQLALQPDLTSQLMRFCASRARERRSRQC